MVAGEENSAYFNQIRFRIKKKKFMGKFALIGLNKSEMQNDIQSGVVS